MVVEPMFYSSTGMCHCRASSTSGHLERRDKSLNLGCLGGHAGNVLLPDLWHQHWNERFVAKDVVLLGR